MQHLTPVGLSKDGKRLVLVSDTGEEYSVNVDKRLRAALRGDHARLGQLEMKMESALRPRDIQARIRAGESAEDVAAAAQTTVEAIMGFAAPVLAERAHVAQLAQKSSIRRRSHEATVAGRTLDQAALAHFSGVGVRSDDVDWDAWRREDGRWTLVATYAVSGSPRRAEFTYDQPGRYVVADNDEAQLLTGEAAPAPAPGSGGARRLSAVSARTSADDELPLGDDAIELVRGRREQSDDLTADHADADWIAEPAAEQAEDSPAVPAAEARPEPSPEPSREPSSEPSSEPTAEIDTTPAATGEPEPGPGQPAASSEPPARPAKPHKKGRSSVPSWDEIMFGGGKND